MQWLIDIIIEWIQGYFCAEDFTVTDDSVCVKDSGIDHDATTNWVANKHIDWTNTAEDINCDDINCDDLFCRDIDLNGSGDCSGNWLVGLDLRVDDKASIGFLGAPDTELHVKGDHVSGVGVFLVEGNAGEHAFMTLDAATGKIPGHIFSINEDGKFYWYVDSAGNFMALYSYDWPGTVAYFENDGDVRFPHVYSHTVGGTNADLYIDSNGYIGLQPCNRTSKENVRDLRNSEWLYDLQCRIADRTDGSAQDIPCFIAEEVAAIMPCMVVYKQTPVIEQRIEESTGQAVDQIVGYELTDEPLTVKHTAFIVPMIREIQKLRRDLNLLKARVNQLEGQHP